MKKIKIQYPTDRVLIFISLMLIAALLSVLWFYGEKINILWQQNGNNNNQRGGEPALTADIRFYIQSAVKSLYNSVPVTDVSQQRVYFPEARFYVPYSDYARTVVYRFDNDSSGGNGFFTSNFNTNIMPGSFDDVPCIQRNVNIVVNSKAGGNGDFVKSVKLADGRMLNLFNRDSRACSDEKWNQGDTSKVVSLLGQAKSY
jgi:hypothetical protein